MPRICREGNGGWNPVYVRPVHVNGKMEKDVKPEDEDGVDGRGGCGWDGCVCDLGAVGPSLAFGLVCGAGAFAAVLPSFVLVSFSATSSFQRETMVGGALARASAFRVVRR